MRPAPRRPRLRRPAPRRDEILDVAVVGAGPAGLGAAVALTSLGLRVGIFDRERIGASFTHWPERMRFITPSFAGNGFGVPDLNAVAPNTSPAFSLGVEHPSGRQYARYLEGVAEHFGIAVREGAEVGDVRRPPGGRFVLDLGARRREEARFVVWAAGEYRAPRRPEFPGAELCLHTGSVTSWADLAGPERVVIGGYESGIDAAAELCALGNRVVVLDDARPWERSDGDPSLELAPVTRARLARAREEGLLELRGERVLGVETGSGGSFRVRCEEGEHRSAAPPLLATGFEPVLGPVAGLLERRDDGYPLLSAVDESTLAPGLFLVGPSVRHDDAILCFVYKFRTRVPVVASAIAARLGVDPAPLEAWREANMWVEDLAGCGEGCEC